jgi:hypothetical protein
MMFQRVLKGMPAEAPGRRGLTDERARAIVDGLGVPCSWWLNAPSREISPRDVGAKLTEEALRQHLVEYDKVRDTTPFISTTAGTVEVNAAKGRYDKFVPEYAALSFATRNFGQPGYLVHAYVFVLGRRSVELEAFAEEVRDVHLYTSYYRWHREGEVVAKVHIPAQCIEKIERYSNVGLQADLDAGRLPKPEKTFRAANVYCDPLRYANVRGFPDLST